MRSVFGVLFPALLFFSGCSFADEFVTLQCSGESQTVSVVKAAPVPFTHIYKVNFDKYEPAVMIAGDDGKFALLEGGKTDRHTVYECVSSDFDIKCNSVLRHDSGVSTRDLSISRVDGVYRSNFAFLGLFSTAEIGGCKKFDEAKTLF